MLSKPRIIVGNAQIWIVRESEGPALGTRGDTTPYAYQGYRQYTVGITDNTCP